MTSEKASRKEKNQNIQVFVRLRPLNQREKDIKSLGIVEVVNNREVVVRQSAQTSLTKKFTFDKAFSPNAKQVEVYQEVVSPLIEEVLCGYNCTVFAYGQTGTGKTHTMVGENSGDESNWQNDPLAGIIPRALSQLFDELRLSNTEYTVRVSYLELYNEELFDLLSTSEDNSKLRIYEDVTRKGSNIVNGLEEITVYNKNEVYKIMAQGQERKRVASTLMNAQSSRSHTVFTIVVHMKENSPEGEELVKIGKLNLVDLAGSENISKAGSDNPAKRERARECVNINQSLLTLGRVITALVERHPHIPYRESKLTRILQESLGGRTKTSIIATISPGHKDMEETLSTLEYAHRAKNIQNKPEVNQKMTKKAILKEYAEEIDRLKRDLHAAREKNGVYLATETYTEMTLKQEEYRKEIQDLILKKRAMEEERDRMESIFRDLNQTLEQKDHELHQTRNTLANTKEKLANTSNILKTTTLHYEEQKHLVERHNETEHKLTDQAKTLLATADLASTHVSHLHCSVDKRKSVENANLRVTQTYREQSAVHRDNMIHNLNRFVETITRTLHPLKMAIVEHTSDSTRSQDENIQKLEDVIKRVTDAITEIKQLTVASHAQLTDTTMTHRSKLYSSVNVHSDSLRQCLNSFVEKIGHNVQSASEVDLKGSVDSFVQEWYTNITQSLTALLGALSSLTQQSHVNTAVSLEAARRRRDGRKSGLAKRDDSYNHCLNELKQEKSHIEQRLSKQLEDIEAEKKETEIRLHNWMEEERRLLEERIASHVATERKAMQDRLDKRMREIEDEKRVMEERFDRYLQWHKTQMQLSEEEMASLETDLKDSEKERESNLQCVDNFGKVFGEGTATISTSLEKFTKDIVNVVEDINSKLMQALYTTKQNIEEDVSQLVTADRQMSSQFTSETDNMLLEFLENSKNALEQVADNAKATSTSTITDLSTVSSALSALISSAQTHAASQTETLDAVQRQAEQFRAELRQDVEGQAMVEGRYLMQEYRVYSPTGKTPVRQDYRYPRQLAATSPHERILARFRAMQHQGDEDDVIIVEADSYRSSDCESSTSEDSAVFTVPSPPAPPAPRQLPPPANALAKSTSDTDVYRQRLDHSKEKDQSKENLSRSASFRKPSKLPAPSSHKKILAERNAN